MGQATRKHPGRVLADDFLAPLGVSSGELAVALSLELSVVESVMRGERDIDADLALRMGVFFDVPAMWWLELQAGHDLQLASKVEGASKFERLDDFVITRSGARPIVRSEEETSHVEMLPVSGELLEMLRAQAKLSAPRAPREVEEITLDNGAQALVGRAE